MTRSMPRGPVPHGTWNGYCNYRCRCGECRAANAQHLREWRATRPLGTAGMIPLKPCGTNAAWWRHQRRGEQPCVPCHEARKAYMRQLYARRQQVAS